VRLAQSGRRYMGMTIECESGASHVVAGQRIERGPALRHQGSNRSPYGGIHEREAWEMCYGRGRSEILAFERKGLA
jgi:hypothetical protein